MGTQIRTSALAALIALCASPIAWAAQPDTPQVERRVIESTNDFRRDERLQPVARSDRLEAAARSFAQYMAQTGKYGHDADGSSPSARARRHGYDYCLVSENISYQYSSGGFTTADLARQFYEGWKNSPGHRKNMLDADATDTAVAVARSERNGYYYAVQMFGKPRSQAIHFQVRNASDAPVRYRVGDDSFTVAPSGVRTHMQCREEALVLEGARGEGAKATARNGERFVVVGDRGRVALRRE